MSAVHRWRADFQNEFLSRLEWSIKPSKEANHAPMVRITIPDRKSLPRHDDAAYAGDLTAWYTAYCAKIEVRPLGTEDAVGATVREKAKAECDT
ncbi:hypothetical protein, partial [Acinetobacter baumannii]|uniref:hypothetical protein n=1 Tax=Acinetobacter baumannii TaxID=470 RepID=UPI0033964B81